MTLSRSPSLIGIGPPLIWAAMSGLSHERIRSRTSARGRSATRRRCAPWCGCRGRGTTADSAAPRPCWGERKEDELGADRLRRGEPVEMLLLHAGNQDHRAGMNLGAAPADAAGGGGGHHRERGHEIGREILVVEARHVQLAGRHHGGGAAVHVVADPADGVLGRRPFAEHRMDMAVDEARHDGAAAGVEHGVGLGVGGRIERRDLAPSISSDVTAAWGLRDVAGEELADVLDEKRGHRDLPALRVMRSL